MITPTSVKGLEPLVVICGGPKTGKTTLANALGEKLGLRHELVAHTDDLVGVLDWSEASAEVARWIYAPTRNENPRIIEGVACARALRKGAVDRPETERPCAIIVRLTVPHVPLTPGQSVMAKGEQTVWDGIRGDMLLRGVEILNGDAWSRMMNRTPTVSTLVEGIAERLQNTLRMVSP